uniref:MOSC domain-containing protein n=1 Tax=Chrysotila carterae TaxID=13221 RepID=A0A7S4BZJ1_CHRCT
MTLCGEDCRGRLFGGAAASEWLSEALGLACKLVRFTAGAARQEGQAFANEAPLLVLSEDAVSMLNTALKRDGHPPVDPRHFRPNIVIGVRLPRDACMQRRRRCDLSLDEGRDDGFDLCQLGTGDDDDTDSGGNDGGGDGDCSDSSGGCVFDDVQDADPSLHAAGRGSSSARMHRSESGSSSESGDESGDGDKGDGGDGGGGGDKDGSKSNE